MSSGLTGAGLNGESTNQIAKIPIITYHSIDRSGSVISTTPEVFRKQIQYLSDAGYSSLPLSQLAASLNSGQSLHQKSIVLTFDDGFRNFYTEAFPVLREYGFTANVFVVTDFCGKFNDWSGNPPNLPRSELLSWTEIEELNLYGIEFGSHTSSHKDLTKLQTAEAKDEIIRSKRDLESALGCKVTTFAYPFGHQNAIVRRIVAANFATACSTNLGKISVNSDFSLLNRIDSYYLSSPRAYKLLQTAAFDHYLRVRQAIRTVKSFLH